MPAKMKSFVPVEPAVLEARRELARRIASITGGPGEHVTAAPGLVLYHRDEPTPCYQASYEPSLSIFVQGRKHVILGETEYVCDSSSFLLSSIDVPAKSQIVEASQKTPLLVMFLRFDMPMVREMLSQEDLPEAKATAHRQGLAVGETTLGLLSACIRLLDLLNTPEDIPFLSPLIQREIIYRLLKTPQAGRLRAIATSGDRVQRTARAIAWLRANFKKPLHIEELANTARMGVSTLHHQFRALTSMSPLQYQKMLRLQTARERMLMDGLDATTAAYEVGYESISQFSREYSRCFGLPPIRDIRALKSSGMTGKQVSVDPARDLHQ
ncbi:AraC family transcriptional regulator [Terriglobus albidus]|uniref:AraC family transcriptional regulator n=1 Tax=Terriglobus albidus TaxID=1592106 RepID=UPI0021DFA05B|nr:AraC family transcriptional regulator [Terriglobus albidus]